MSCDVTSFFEVKNARIHGRRVVMDEVGCDKKRKLILKLENGMFVIGLIEDGIPLFTASLRCKLAFSGADKSDSEEDRESICIEIFSKLHSFEPSLKRKYELMYTSIIEGNKRDIDKIYKLLAYCEDNTDDPRSCWW